MNEFLQKNQINSSVDKQEESCFSLKNALFFIKKSEKTDMVYSRFLEIFKESFFSFVREEVSISSQELSLIKYKDFLESIEKRPCLNMFEVQKIPGVMFVVFQNKFLYSLMNYLLGGLSFRNPDSEEHEFTKIEINLVKRLVNLIVCDLERAWNPVFPIKFNFLKTEVNPDIAKFLSLSLTDFFVLKKINVSFKYGEGSFSILMPYSFIKKINSNETSEKKVSSKNEIWSKKINSKILNTYLELKFIIGECEMSMLDVTRLASGDILVLEKEDKNLVEVVIEDVHKFSGFYGKKNNKKVIQINNFIGEKNL